MFQLLEPCSLHNYSLETVSMTNEVSKQQTVGSLACRKTMHVGLGAVLITAYLSSIVQNSYMRQLLNRVVRKMQRKFGYSYVCTTLSQLLHRHAKVSKPHWQDVFFLTSSFEKSPH